MVLIYGLQVEFHQHEMPESSNSAIQWVNILSTTCNLIYAPFQVQRHFKTVTRLMWMVTVVKRMSQ